MREMLERAFVKETWEQIRPVAPLIYIGMSFDAVALVLAVIIGIGTSLADCCLNIMAVLLGMGLSIPVGLLVSPVNKDEKSAFNEIGKALLTFVSGYLLSKLGDTISTVLSPDYLLTPTVGFRLFAFVLCFGVGVPTMYAVRSRFAPTDNKTAQNRFGTPSDI